jgi:hypothetical protein
VAARRTRDVREALERSLLPSQRTGSDSFLVGVRCFVQRGVVPFIPCRLQDETARVEDQLLKPETLEALLKCFVTAKANSFEGLLDPFLKICRLSTNIAIGIAKSQFFKRVVDRLGHSKALVRLNLLRIVKTVCDVHPNRAILVESMGYTK